MIPRRAWFVTIALATLTLGGVVATGLFLYPIVEVPPLVPPSPVVAAPQEELVIRGVVAEVRFPEPDDVVDVIGCSDVSRCYLVKLASVSSTKGELPENSLAILVHSPSQDLGIARVGQSLRLRLARTTGPVEVVVAPSRLGTALPSLARVKYEVLSSR